MDMKWIADVHDSIWTAADGTPLGGFAYTYDAAGNRTAKMGDVEGDVAYTRGVGDRLSS